MPEIFGGHDDTPRRGYFEIGPTIDVSATRSFEVGERIRAGGNGVVHRCTDAAGDEYAVKFQINDSPDRIQRFDREIDLLSGIAHDHLVTYQGHGSTEAVRIGKSGPSANYQKTKLKFVVMSLAQASLFDEIKKRASIPAVYLPQFRGLARALGLLHSKAVHRDIKPDNILVIGDRWVLSDFGLCHITVGPPVPPLTPDWQIVGPRFWLSPEANNQSIGRNDEIGPASDVFQLASVFWYVVNRTHPTGILSSSDWSGPSNLFEPIFKALHYDLAVRPKDGNVFADWLDEAILL